MATNQNTQGARLEKLRKSIREAFSFFDKVGNGTVFHEEVGTIMRYLGQFPSETDVVETILREIQEDDPSTTVTYENFEKLMLRSLHEHTYDPDDAETLLAAFRVLDPDNRGWLDGNQMREFLSSGTVGFREKEMSEFLEFAKDKESADATRIYYEDYVAKLTSCVEKHIESLYQDARNTENKM